MQVLMLARQTLYQQSHLLSSSPPSICVIADEEETWSRYYLTMSYVSNFG